MEGGAVGLLQQNVPEWLMRRPKALQRLVGEAEARGITLLLMAEGMGRRVENTTAVVKLNYNLD
ncbi:unnamed protein product, partial [Discosporangium mesarthrocarpum]